MSAFAGFVEVKLVSTQYYSTTQVDPQRISTRVQSANKDCDFLCAWHAAEPRL